MPCFRKRQSIGSNLHCVRQCVWCHLLCSLRMLQHVGFQLPCLRMMQCVGSQLPGVRMIECINSPAFCQNDAVVYDLTCLVSLLCRVSGLICLASEWCHALGLNFPDLRMMQCLGSNLSCHSLMQWKRFYLPGLPSSSVPLGHPLSAYKPIVFSRLFHEGGNFKDSQSLSSVSCRMSDRLFHETETPKDHLSLM